MHAAKSQNSSLTKLEKGALEAGSVLVILYIISLSQYLLFHSLSEITSAIIACGVFIVAWNSRRFISNNYFLFIGIAFLAVGILRILHVLTYAGMDVFSDSNNANHSAQLWIACQFILSISLLIAPAIKDKKLNPIHILLSYLIVFILVIISVFQLEIFPIIYREGSGFTPAGIYSECIISLIFVASVFIFHHQKERFDKQVFNLLSGASFSWAIAEALLSFNTDPAAFSVVLSHLINIVAFYLAYLGIVEMGLMNPYRLLFKELKDREKELQYEKDKIVSILDNMEDGVYIINNDLEITYINPAMQRDFGKIKPHEKCYQYLHNETKPCANCQNFKNIPDLHTVRWEKYYPKSEKTYDVIESPIITANNTINKLEIFRDISKRKEIEHAKDEFISLAAHQLRTPLANISLSSELLLRGISGAITEEQREYLDEIYRSTKRMSILISNFLDVSRIEMGNFHISPAPLNIANALEQIIKDFIPLIENKNLKMTKEIATGILPVQFDIHVFRMIIENLLSNAIRYTPSGGKIHVSLKYAVGRILITIADTGCGIPEDEQEMIFSKSFRTTNAKAISSEGAGLGLYMAKRAAQKTGCDIWFSPQPETGTAFHVSVPIER